MSSSFSANVHAPVPAIADGPAPDRPFQIRRDRDRAMVIVTGQGSWTGPIVDAHFDTLGAVLDEIRAAAEPVRVLVDLTQAPEQSMEVMARIGAGKARIYRPDDRVALVMSTSRGKLQMRGAHDAPNHALFLSMNAAMTWLFAWG